jgi:hypothetical protein
VYIFVDENFPKDVRTSAQSLFNLMILGIAQFASNSLWGVLKDYKVFDGPDGINYHQLFLVPTGFALFAAVLLALFFHPVKTVPAEEREGVPVAAH